jgi:Domain of unknown function (DUF5666)
MKMPKTLNALPSNNLGRYRGARSAHRWLPALGLSLLVAACGGGGSSGTDGAAAAGTSASALAVGPITGFGSVIVNGVRFEDNTARIADDDDNGRSRDELRLGMIAQVLSTDVVSDASGLHGSASEIRFGSEIVGPVASIATDGKSLVVLGETVIVTTTTLFDDRIVGGIGGLRAGTSVVEVHGVFDAATGNYTATRIEPKTNALLYKLKGVVANLDKTAHTFRIGTGTDTISYDAIAAAAPAAFDNGMLVRVNLQKVQVAGRWVATSIANGARKVEDHAEAELEGAITATTFATDKKFSVNGIAVDASSATFPTGTTGIVLGARVEVKGSAAGGVVIATRVSIETESDRVQRGFELHGAVSALDTAAKTFVLRGVTVKYDGAGVEFRKGTASELANGRNVEVKGTRSSDGTTLQATRISFES